MKEEGVAGLFRGLTTTWIRNIPGSFFYFGGNEASRRFLTPRGGDSEEHCKLLIISRSTSLEGLRPEWSKPPISTFDLGSLSLPGPPMRIYTYITRLLCWLNMYIVHALKVYYYNLLSYPTDYTGVWRMALAGGIAGCCFWTAMFPADVVRSRIYVSECSLVGNSLGYMWYSDMSLWSIFAI